MDQPIVGAYFVAEAVNGDGGWSVLVHEYYWQTASVVVPMFITPVKTGLAAEAFEPLTYKGWTIGGPTRFDNFTISVDIEPPADHTVEPVAGAEFAFVRRCRARGMPAVEALRAYRDGDREPGNVADRWRQEQSLTFI
jgi:hypothetical protein